MSDARLLLDLLPKPVALVDTALIVHDANRAFITRFGLARSHEGTPARGQFWEGLARTVARMQPAAKLGAFRWTGHDGDDRRFDVRATRVADNRFLVVADDVSEYLEVEAIQGGVRHYVEGVLNHLPQGLLVLDAAFHVTFYNAAQADLWREEPEMPLPLETIGLPVWQVSPRTSAARWRSKPSTSTASGSPPWARRRCRCSTRSRTRSRPSSARRRRCWRRGRWPPP